MYSLFTILIYIYNLCKFKLFIYTFIYIDFNTMKKVFL